MSLAGLPPAHHLPGLPVGLIAAPLTGPPPKSWLPGSSTPPSSTGPPPGQETPPPGQETPVRMGMEARAAASEAAQRAQQQLLLSKLQHRGRRVLMPRDRLSSVSLSAPPAVAEVAARSQTM